MRNPAGFTFETTVDGNVLEGDSMMCGHCNKHIPLKAFVRPEDFGGFCKKCMSTICPHCLKIGGCDPIEAKLDRWEKQGFIS